MLLYGSSKEAEGEWVVGQIFGVRITGSEHTVVRINAPVATDPPAPVWAPDGSAAYFKTGDGIYKLSSMGAVPQLVRKGASQGLVVSPDGNALAFWLLDDDGNASLVVYDLRKRAPTREWRLPLRFQSETGPWDLAFNSNGRLLYARTFEEDSSTPLKQFDLQHGRIAPVSRLCYAVADADNGIYFIQPGTNTNGLWKIVEGESSPRSVITDFNYSHLFRGGNRRWLVAQDWRTQQLAIIDTKTDTVRSIGKHDSATILYDGSLVVANKGEITVGPPLESRRER